MAHNARIMIVDDEQHLCKVLQRTLQREGYIVDTANSGQQAIRLLQEDNYDLLLLDLNMYPMNGLEVLRQIREHDSDLVVIVLTGHSSLESAIACLRLGAFDYLLKPASPEEIRARVHDGLTHRRRILQRAHLLQQINALKTALAQLDLEIKTAPRGAPSRFLHSGDLTLDRYHRVATLGDRPLDLTTTEFDLLVCLVRASPEPASAVDLVQCALGYQTFPAEAREIIKWHIHRLRRKLETDAERPRQIKTVRGRGYLWVP